MRYIELAKAILFAYKSNVSELERLNKHSTSVTTEVKGFTKGRISKPVETAVLRLLADERHIYLSKSIESVDYALLQVKRFSEGEKTIKLFELVYYNKTYTIIGAAMELGISEITAKRYNAYLVKMVALKAGLLPTK